ncbi:helix-turn-helix domain-containing protein [Herbiconiux solani]|uniref:helix-turn-helix domain-containing protein n=1 Tax=Herbiconiux solani TaxID=661329 RepID=UPI000826884C|nr:helix-turn-helix domain-containing protein [Herbiconiux solani]
MAYKATHWAWELDLPTTRKFTLIALADMADEEFSCFPGQERLARMIGASVDTVQRALKSLEEDGYIERQARRRDDGYRTSDRYRLRVGSSHRNMRPKNLTPQPLAPHTANGTDLTPHSAGVITSKNHHESPDMFDLDIPADSTGAGSFAEFYMAYPRKVGKEAARKAFAAASKKTDPADIIAGAQRFASDPNLPEKQFIPHPSTWLSHGRWDDEPLPARATEQPVANPDAWMQS